jgi:hypothetical protein
MANNPFRVRPKDPSSHKAFWFVAHRLAAESTAMDAAASWPEPPKLDANRRSTVTRARRYNGQADTKDNGWRRVKGSADGEDDGEAKRSRAMWKGQAIGGVCWPRPIGLQDSPGGMEIRPPHSGRFVFSPVGDPVGDAGASGQGGGKGEGGKSELGITTTTVS